MILKELVDWFFELLYTLQKSLCYLIDFIREVFYKLGGVESVSIDGEESEILTHFVMSEAVRNSFLMVLLIGVMLLTVFTIVAIIKSEIAEGQHKKTKGQILVKSMQSFISFLLVPFVLIAFIVLSNAIMNAINVGMNQYSLIGYSHTSLGGQILVTSGADAYIGEAGMQKYIEQQFITGELSYLDFGTVRTYYDLNNINYVVGILGSVVILVMFTMSTVMFVQRIFDVVLLYIVSPVSISTIPTDDGNRYRLWKELTIGKVLGAYGIILSMNLFFIIVPQVSNIIFFDNSFKDGVVKLLFMIGGAYAVTKANVVISQLTNSNGGGQETEQLIQNIRTGAHIAKATTGVAMAGLGMAIGGTQFVRRRRYGYMLSDNLNKSIHGGLNQRAVSTMTGGAVNGFSKATRLATLPLGVIKDLFQGGVITAGKNIKPRIDNVLKGSGYLNHADIVKPPEKGEKNDKINT